MNNPIAIFEDRKEKLVERLSTQFSLNKISMDEYERLVKYSQDIQTDKELIIFEQIIDGHDKTDINDVNRTSAYLTNSRQDSRSQNFITFMSSRKTTSDITNGNFVTVMGEQKIVIDEDDLIYDETEINVLAIMGEISIHVPENIRVVNKVIPILSSIGSVPDKLNDKNKRKKIIINGNAIMGEIRVKVKK